MPSIGISAIVLKAVTSLARVMFGWRPGKPACARQHIQVVDFVGLGPGLLPDPRSHPNKPFLPSSKMGSVWRENSHMIFSAQKIKKRAYRCI